MNQRTLVTLFITTAGNSLAGAQTTGAAFDLAQNNVTTQAWTFANIGRREMKLGGAFVNMFTGTSNCTYAAGILLGATTSAPTSWTPISNTTFGGTVTQDASNFTTNRGFFQIADMHFMSNYRYIAPQITINGATTASVMPVIFVQEEQRAS